MIYTRELLEKRRTIQDCRSILYDLGGTPSNKNKEKLIDEILKIQSGEIEPVRTVRRPNSKDFKYREDEFETVTFNANENIEDSPEEVYCGELAVSGVLDIVSEYGFLRGSNLREDSASDVYVAKSFIREKGLKSGDYVVGKASKRRDLSVNALNEVTSVNGKEANYDRVCIDDAPVSYPTQKLNLGGSIETRIVDAFAPIGKGQRCIISAAAKSGATTLINKIASDLSRSDDVEVILLLVAERPEEANDILSRYKNVYFSTFEDDAATQLKISNLALNRAKRLAEDGKDVVLIIDSLTELVKAGSEVEGAAFGEIKYSAINKAKGFLGAARCLDSGSLTVIATIKRGLSPIYESVYEELKTAANSEIALNKSLYESEIFPTFNFISTQTSKAEYLIGNEGVKAALKLKRLADGSEDLAELISLFNSTKNNAELIQKLLEQYGK